MYAANEKQRHASARLFASVFIRSLLHQKKPGEFALTGPEAQIKMLSQGLVGSAGFGSVAGMEADSGCFVSVELALAGLEASLL